MEYCHITIEYWGDQGNPFIPVGRISVPVDELGKHDSVNVSLTEFYRRHPELPLGGNFLIVPELPAPPPSDDPLYEIVLPPEMFE